MTIEIVDIEKLRKINMADEFIGCFLEHVLRENGQRSEHDGLSILLA
jgi:hypothetical protein